MKTKVLIIKTGGTIAQKPDLEEILHPSLDDYMYLIKGLDELAYCDVIDLCSIDSTNMETNLASKATEDEQRWKDRANIAQVIYENSSDYDGFVVVHGTDTMAETAAALTYMIQNLRKPIVLTGAQRSIWAKRTDAPNNVYTAVQAATMDIGEVVIAFGNYILRGTRARKTSEEDYDAFSTPDVEPIGKVTALREGIRLREHRTRRSPSSASLFTNFDTRVFHYNHISGALVDEDLSYIARSKSNHAILLGSFGAGNIPARLLGFIIEANENGKPVFVYTRCEIGAADMGIYSVGAAPLKAGAKSAGDMTLEALGQKMMYALGLANEKFMKGRERIDFVESIIKKGYNGDITVTERRK